MKQAPFMVKKIYQKSNHVFVIEWSDDIATEYRLSDLQRRCPCAKCFDPATEKQIVDASTINDDLRAQRIFNVGRYALRIQFSSGCSAGIYSFAQLREFSKGV